VGNVIDPQVSCDLIGDIRFLVLVASQLTKPLNSTVDKDVAECIDKLLDLAGKCERGVLNLNDHLELIVEDAKIFMKTMNKLLEKAKKENSYQEETSRDEYGWAEISS
jgi:hypothetical protein